jgi:uncharacterized protein involved in exopolysaccharide biosynthesis
MAGELMAPTVGLTVMDATTRSTPGTPITADVRQEQVIANLRQQADDVRERERERSQRMARLGGGGFKAQEGPEAELRNCARVSRRCRRKKCRVTLPENSRCR